MLGYGLDRDGSGYWRKLHNEELNDLYFSPNIVREIKTRWAGHVARIGERRVYIGFRLGKHEGKRSFR